eukprot:1537983-Prymnesium_polylepis.1
MQAYDAMLPPQGARNKGARQACQEGQEKRPRPSPVGVAQAGSPAQRATSAVFPRHHCDRRSVRLRSRVGR